MRFWIIISLIFTYFSGYSESFFIKDYNISITINDDASILIDERIMVSFTEDRRGIIRSIPFTRNTNYIDTWEKTNSSAFTAMHHLLFEDVDVPDHPFTTYEEEGKLKIRIGDPDIYVRGDVHYHIKYKVYGVMLENEDFAEFYWNIIGNEWPVEIEKVTFDISYPGNNMLKQENYHVFTGYEGSREKNANLITNEGNISGSSTKVLEAQEGITIGIRWPKKVFKTLEIPIEKLAHNFYINELNTQLKIKDNGSVVVSEEIDFQPVQSMNSFVRVLAIPPHKGESDKNIYPFIDEIYVSVEDMSPKNFRVILSGEKYQPVIQVIPNTAFNTRKKIKIDYNVWGTIGKKEERYELNWNINSGYQNEPIQSTKINIEGLENNAEGKVRFAHQNIEISEYFDIQKSKGTYIIQSNQRIISGSFTDFKLSLDKAGIELGHMPLKVYAKEFYVSHFDKRMFLSKNGEMLIEESYFPKYRYGNKAFKALIKTGNIRPKYEIPFFNGLNLLGRNDRFYYDVLSTEGVEQSTSLYPYTNFKLQEGIEEGLADNPTFSYKLAGYVQKKNGERILKIPIWIPNSEPFINGRAILKWEQNEIALKNRLVDDHGKLIRDIPASSDSIIIHLNGDKLSSSPIYLETLLPSGVVTASFSTTLGLFLTNNMALIFLIVILLFLALLWRLIGRDKIDPVIARFYPPEDMTPAEAGFIYDGKLHSKDLVALIYFWAANGNIKINEIEGKKKKPDYELVKIKDLSDNARKYENILFDGLFDGRDKVKISSLKNKFYTTYNEAKKAFKVYEKKMGFYARGTRGLGLFLKIIGIMIMVLSIGFLIYAYVERDFSFGLPLFLAGLFTFIFGKIMPRLKRKSAKTLSELLGFQEFIRTAEIGKLQTLVKEQPEYFGLTIPFAIVMGDGEQWADRFDSLMLAPPDYYEGYSRSHFTPSLFTHDLMSNMRHVRQTLTSSPSSSSSGSSFSGGGFSGGGFGGGGGSSW